MGPEGEKNDSDQQQRITRSGKLSEKSNQEAIKKQETEELGRKLRKRFREAGDKLERDQQPQPGPSGQQQQHQTAHLPTPASDELQVMFMYLLRFSFPILVSRFQIVNTILKS